MSEGARRKHTRSGKSSAKVQQERQHWSGLQNVLEQGVSQQVQGSSDVLRMTLRWAAVVQPPPPPPKPSKKGQPQQEVQMEPSPPKAITAVLDATLHCFAVEAMPATTDNKSRPGSPDVRSMAVELQQPAQSDYVSVGKPQIDYAVHRRRKYNTSDGDNKSKPQATSAQVEVDGFYGGDVIEVDLARVPTDVTGFLLSAVLYDLSFADLSNLHVKVETISIPPTVVTSKRGSVAAAAQAKVPAKPQHTLEANVLCTSAAHDLDTGCSCFALLLRKHMVNASTSAASSNTVTPMTKSLPLHSPSIYTPVPASPGALGNANTGSYFWEIVCVDEIHETRDLAEMHERARRRGLDPGDDYCGTPQVLHPLSIPDARNNKRVDSVMTDDEDDDDFPRGPLDLDEARPPMATLLASVPRIVREATRKYNVGKPVAFGNRHRDDQHGSDDDEQRTVVESMKAVAPLYDGSSTVRFGNGAYNIGSQISNLKQHLMDHRVTYEAADDGVDHTPPPLISPQNAQRAIPAPSTNKRHSIALSTTLGTNGGSFRGLSLSGSELSNGQRSPQRDVVEDPSGEVQEAATAQRLPPSMTQMLADGQARLQQQQALMQQQQAKLLQAQQASNSRGGPRTQPPTSGRRMPGGERVSPSTQQDFQERDGGTAADAHAPTPFRHQSGRGGGASRGLDSRGGPRKPPSRGAIPNRNDDASWGRHGQPQGDQSMFPQLVSSRNVLSGSTQPPMTPGDDVPYQRPSDTFTTRIVDGVVDAQAPLMHEALGSTKRMPSDGGDSGSISARLLGNDHMPLLPLPYPEDAPQSDRRQGEPKHTSEFDTGRSTTSRRHDHSNAEHDKDREFVGGRSGRRRYDDYGAVPDGGGLDEHVGESRDGRRTHQNFGGSRDGRRTHDDYGAVPDGRGLDEHVGESRDGRRAHQNFGGSRVGRRTYDDYGADHDGHRPSSKRYASHPPFVPTSQGYIPYPPPSRNESRGARSPTSRFQPSMPLGGMALNRLSITSHRSRRRHHVRDRRLSGLTAHRKDNTHLFQSINLLLEGLLPTLPPSVRHR